MQRINLVTYGRLVSALGVAWVWCRWVLLTLLAAALVAALMYLDVASLFREGLSRVDELGPMGPLLLVVFYVVGAVCLVPGSILAVSTGAVLGLPWALVYASVASTLGAVAAFLVGRHLARDWVGRRIEGNATFAAIDGAVEREGWRIVLLTRLSPVFPYNILNYAFGLTGVKLRHYVIASWIGMIPSTLAWVYLGSLAHAGVEAARRTPAEWALYGLGLVATVAVVLAIMRIARNALVRRTGQVLDRQ